MRDGLRTYARDKGNGNRYIKIKDEKEVHGLIDFVGDYELKYDPTFEIFYIEKEIL